MTSVEPLLLAGGVWLWENYGKNFIGWLAKNLGKQVEEIKDVGWGKIDWALTSRKYREELKEQYGYMHIFGMNQSVLLNNIFTDVYLLNKPNSWRRQHPEEVWVKQQTKGPLFDEVTRYNGIDLVKKEKRLFILGQPGAGKTTFLKHIVIQAVQGVLDAVPIFVSLKAWSDSGIDILDFMVRQFAICDFPDALPFVEKILKDGKAIVLFDGLDEVNQEGGARNRITNSVRDFAWRYGKNHIVITCRTAATDHVFERFNYCELADFTTDQMKSFVARWFQTNETKREEFWKAFEKPENDRLRDLSRRPLLLTMLCLTFDETMTFPLRRAELYEEALDALLKKWDSSRSIQRDLVYRKLSLGYKRQLLMEIAAENFDSGRIFMNKNDLMRVIVQFVRRLPPLDESEDVDGEIILKSIESQHGLLIEQAQGVYSFSHLTFHEYFVARYIVENPEREMLKNLATHTVDKRWREVILLTTSLLNYRNVTLLFDIWNDQLQEYIQSEQSFQNLVKQVHKHFSSESIYSSPIMRAKIASTIILYWIHTCLQKAYRLYDNIGDIAKDLDRESPLAIHRSESMSFDIIKSITNELQSSIIDNINQHSIFMEKSINITSNFKKRVERISERTRSFGMSKTMSERVNEHKGRLDYSINQLNQLAGSIDFAIGIVSLSKHIISRISSYEQDVSLSERHLCTCKNIGEEMIFSVKGFKEMEKYFTSVMCLLDSLEVASVENRLGNLKILLLS